MRPPGALSRRGAGLGAFRPRAPDAPRPGGETRRGPSARAAGEGITGSRAGGRSGAPSRGGETARPGAVCLWEDEGASLRASRRGPAAGGRRVRSMGKRPSDRRGPGRNPGPQCAFEVSMINVSCNSH